MYGEAQFGSWGGYMTCGRDYSECTLPSPVDLALSPEGLQIVVTRASNGGPLKCAPTTMSIFTKTLLFVNKVKVCGDRNHTLYMNIDGIHSEI